MSIRSASLASIVTMALASACFGESKPSTVNSQLRVPSIAGGEAHPFRCGAEKAAMVIFISIDCPIANRFAPEIERIWKEYSVKGIGLTLVHVDPDLEVETAKSHAQEYNLSAPLVIDREHALVRATGATMIPEAVVVDAAEKIRYRGRINDLFANYGERRKEAKTHDLRDALDAVLAGKPVSTPETQALGCVIQPLPGD